MGSVATGLFKIVILFRTENGLFNNGQVIMGSGHNGSLEKVIYTLDITYLIIKWQSWFGYEWV